VITPARDRICQTPVSRMRDKAIQQWFLPLCLLLIILYSPADASDIPTDNADISVRSLSDIEGGSSLIPVESDNHYLRAPLLDTTVQIGVQGKLTGTRVEQPSTSDINQWAAIEKADLPATDKRLDKLWAHRKIQSLENDLLLNADSQRTKDAIPNIATDYSLVTKYTNPAVEQKVSREPTTEALQTVAVLQPIPAGNSMLFPQGSPGTRSRFIVSLLFAILSVIFGLASLRQTRQFSQPLYRTNFQTNALSLTQRTGVAE